LQCTVISNISASHYISWGRNYYSHVTGSESIQYPSKAARFVTLRFRTQTRILQRGTRSKSIGTTKEMVLPKTPARLSEMAALRTVVEIKHLERFSAVQF